MIELCPPSLPSLQAQLALGGTAHYTEWPIPNHTPTEMAATEGVGLIVKIPTCLPACGHFSHSEDVSRKRRAETLWHAP